jgi:uncharacterized protein with FMN-binding domain
MKKFVLSIIVLGSFGLYVVSQNGGNSSGNTSGNNFTVPAPIVATNPTKKIVPNNVAIIPTSPIVNNPPPVVSAPKKNGIYNDGTYTGDSVDAYYGNVQVEAVISGGRLANIQFLDYPKDRGNSIRISNKAMPILTKEAIIAQSAKVNIVSGASETSQAFMKSLTSALNQAKV